MANEVKVLVIGGSGFVGLPLVKKLINKNYDVTILGRRPLTIPLDKQVTFMQLNRKDVNGFLSRCRGLHFDVIYDLAAFMARDILQICHWPQAMQSRYIYVSTAAVYGLPEPAQLLDEDTIPSPVTDHAYGCNKRLAEQALIQSSLSFVIVRPCVVYGPCDSQKQRAWYFFRRIQQNIPLLIPGRQEVKNNYIYVEDLADLLIQAIKFPSRTIVNAAGAEIFTWETYLHTLAKIMGTSLPPVRALAMTLKQFKNWQYARRLHFYHNAFSDFTLDISRAQNLGFNPGYSLAEGLKNTWNWLQAGPEIFNTREESFELEKELFASYEMKRK